MAMITFGEWVADRRERVGLNQTALAKRVSQAMGGVEVTRDVIWQLEHGKPQNPKPDMVQAVARAVERPVTEALAVLGYELPPVRQVYRWYLEGVGTQAICLRLEAAGIPSPSVARGYADRAAQGRPALGRWLKARVLRMLGNPAYRGSWQWGTLAVAVPPLVDDVTWQALARQREDNARLAGRNTTRRVYLLRSLLVCGACGGRYVGNWGGTRGRRVAYYQCHRRRAGRGECGNPHLPAEVVEADVWALVCGRLEQPEAILSEIAARLRRDAGEEESLQVAAAGLEARVSALVEEEQRVVGLYRRRLIDEAAVERQLRAVASERVTAQGDMAILAGRLAALRAQEATLLDGAATLARLREQAATATGEARGRLLRRLVARVVVHGDGSLTAELVYAEAGATEEARLEARGLRL